jgi:pSer/pThr/pTyr-binding forkhead associated (FHA) protein
MMDKIHLRLGSYPDNDMIIESEGVDGHHLELFCDSDGNVFITDLNTKNGTFINGEELSGYALLKLGDKVVLGRHYVFRWESFIRSEESQQKADSFVKEEQKRVDNQTTKPIIQAKDQVSIKQLILIYAAILIMIILMFFVF